MDLSGQAVSFLDVQQQINKTHSEDVLVPETPPPRRSQRSRLQTPLKPNNALLSGDKRWEQQKYMKMPLNVTGLAWLMLTGLYLMRG